MLCFSLLMEKYIVKLIFLDLEVITKVLQYCWPNLISSFLLEKNIHHYVCIVFIAC